MNAKDCNGQYLSYGDKVECIDPGQQLGLDAGHFYTVTEVLDPWTISVRPESNEEKLSPRMAGRFRGLKYPIA